MTEVGGQGIKEQRSNSVAKEMDGEIIVIELDRRSLKKIEKANACRRQADTSNEKLLLSFGIAAPSRKRTLGKGKSLIVYEER